MTRVAFFSTVTGAALSGGVLWVLAAVTLGLTIASWRVLYSSERRIEERIEQSEDRILTAIKDHVERRQVER